LECAGQVTGGYFADPGKKNMPGLAQLGHPFADVYPNGSACISKVPGTGGMVNLQTAKEQLLYEVTNPHEYYTPDVVADFTSVQLLQSGSDAVLAQGGGGRTKPPTYKVSVGYQAFYLGEGEITYAGGNAAARAQLAGQIIQQRLAGVLQQVQVDYVGITSAHHLPLGGAQTPYEVRLRVAAKAPTPELAALVGEEVEALYTNGPAGGGGARKYVTEVVGILSTVIDRNLIQPAVTVLHT
jgi:hypothetical protein